MSVLLLPLFKTIALVLDIYVKIVVVEIVIHWLIHVKILSVKNNWKYIKQITQTNQHINLLPNKIG